MIHKEANIAYLHLSKTGGWYVSRILKDFCFSNINNAVNRGHIGVSEIPSDVYTFGFVRHPFAWYRSLFNYFYDCNWGLDKKSNCQNVGFLQSSSINTFIDLLRKHEIWDYNVIYYHFFGVGTYSQCNYIGKYEQMNDQLKDILTKFAELLYTDQEMIDNVFNKYRNHVVNKSKRQIDDRISLENREYIYENCKDIFIKYNYSIDEQFA